MCALKGLPNVLTLGSMSEPLCYWEPLGCKSHLGCISSPRLLGRANTMWPVHSISWAPILRSALGPCIFGNPHVPCTIYQILSTLYSISCTIHHIPSTLYSISCTSYHISKFWPLIFEHSRVATWSLLRAPYWISEKC